MKKTIKKSTFNSTSRPIKEITVRISLSILSAVLIFSFLCSCDDKNNTDTTPAISVTVPVTSQITSTEEITEPPVCTEHIFNQTTLISPATLITPALYTKTCTVCNYTTKGYDMNTAYHNVTALTDQTGCNNKGSICVINLDAPDPTSKDAVIWEFTPTRSKGFKYFTTLDDADDAKFEYCKEIDSYVFLFCASSGQCGIVKYPSGECVWQYNTPSSSTHSIEMLNNGFVAIANVKDFAPGYQNVQGCIKVFNYMEGGNSPVAIAPLQNAHGMIFDSENDILWAYGKDKQMLDKDGSSLCKMKLNCSDGKYTLDRETTYYTKKAGEHDITFSPDKKYIWCTNTKYIYRFCIESGVFENKTELFIKPEGTEENFDGYKSVFESADGTIVYCCATRKNSPSFTYATQLVSVLKPDGDGYLRTVLEFPDRMIYRAKPVVPVYEETEFGS